MLDGEHAALLLPFDLGRLCSDAWCTLGSGFFRTEDSLENRGKVLASLERLGTTPVVPPLGPGHEAPRFVFAQIPKLEDRGLEHFCQRHERVSILASVTDMERTDPCIGFCNLDNMQVLEALPLLLLQLQEEFVDGLPHLLLFRAGIHVFFIVLVTVVRGQLC